MYSARRFLRKPKEYIALLLGLALAAGVFFSILTALKPTRADPEGIVTMHDYDPFAPMLLPAGYGWDSGSAITTEGGIHFPSSGSVFKNTSDYTAFSFKMDPSNALYWDLNTLKFAFNAADINTGYAIVLYGGFTNTLVLTYNGATVATLITHYATTSMDQGGIHVVVKITDPVTRAFTVSVNGQVRATVASPLSPPSQTGFGASCAAAGITSPGPGFANVELGIPGAAPPAYPVTVNFYEAGTTNPLRAPVVETGYEYQYYTVNQPFSLPGGWIYANCEKHLWEPQMVRRNAQDNVIDIFYRSVTVEKDASYGGVPDRGEQDDPVPVSLGQVINYTIPIASASAVEVPPIRKNKSNIFVGTGNDGSNWGYTNSHPSIGTYTLTAQRTLPADLKPGTEMFVTAQMNIEKATNQAITGSAVVSMTYTNNRTGESVLLISRTINAGTYPSPTGGPWDNAEVVPISNALAGDTYTLTVTKEVTAAPFYFYWAGWQPTLVFNYESTDMATKDALILTDTLPPGLTFVPGSNNLPGGSYVTSFSYNSVTRELKWETGLVPIGVTGFTFQALVDAPGIFENTAEATFQGGLELPSNPTYHATTVVRVTEHFLEYGTDAQLKADQTNSVTKGGDWSVPAGSLGTIAKDGRTYSYYGFDLHDGMGFQAGNPPAGSPPTFANLQASEDITLYFRQNPQVAVKFYDYDSPATQIKADAPRQTVLFGDNYYLPGGHLSQIAYASEDYNYCGYSVDGGVTVLPGSPPAPLLAGLTADAEVRLYFRAAPAVAAHFVEHLNCIETLRNDQSYVLAAKGDDFTLPAATMNPIISSFTGKYYGYCGYSIGAPTDDPGQIIAGPPPPFLNVQGNQEITLYFDEGYSLIKDAYLHDGTSYDTFPANGADDDWIPVKQGDKIKYVLTVPRPAPPVFSGPAPKPAPVAVGFVNGSFEDPDIRTCPTSWLLPSQIVNIPNWTNFLDGYLPGWHAVPLTVTGLPNDYTAQVLRNSTGAAGSFKVPYPDGNQCAELNAETNQRLYQDVATTPGTKIYWEFWHATRINGTTNYDELMFSLRPAGTPLATPTPDQIQCNARTRGIDGWKKYSGSYTVPPGQTNTEFGFAAISWGASGSVSAGNDLDAIRLYGPSYVELQLSHDKGAGDVSVGEVVTYTIVASNTGECDASGVTVTDKLPIGAAFVPGSIRLGAAVISDAIGYNAATRTVSVNIGNIKGIGSPSTDCQNSYTITFQVTMQGGGAVWNQASVDYNDREFETEPENLGGLSNVSDPVELRLPLLVEDIIPGGLRILSIGQGGAADGQRVTWDLDAMAEQQVYTLTVEVEVEEPGQYENAARVLDGSDPPPESNHTYHEWSGRTLHIRQIVIEPLSGLQRPAMGYYILLNDGTTLPLTSDSVTPGFPFTEYTLTPSADKIYALTDIVPQYYEFAGHKQNDGPSESGHPTASPIAGADAATLNGDVTLDFTNTGEIWITVYIRPRGMPGEHQTGVESNRFGTVYADQ